MILFCSLVFFYFSMSCQVSLVTLSQLYLLLLPFHRYNHRSLSHPSLSIFLRFTIRFYYNCFISKVVVLTVNAVSTFVHIFLYRFNIYCICTYDFILNHYHLIECCPFLLDICFEIWFVSF